jgi:ligand-binding sensor domain-containing protein
LLTSFFLAQELMAQQEKQYSFIHYAVNNGLAAYDASSIVQDDQGFIWISTINGLQRFDGNRFITFRHIPGNSKSIPDNHINQLLFDKQKRLWMLLGNGKVGTFDTRRFIFNEVKLVVEDPNYLRATRTLIEDSKGQIIYMMHFVKLLMYNEQLNEFSAVHNTIKVPPKWRVINLVEDPSTNNYWLGTDSGIAVYNSKTKKISYRGNNAEQHPLIQKLQSPQNITCFILDNKSRIWFESWDTPDGPFIYCYDLKINKIVLNHYSISPLLKKYYEPLEMLQQKDGTLWLRGLNVLMKYIEERKTFEAVYNGYITGQGIYFDRINCLFEDREKNIWVATNNNGVYVFNPSGQLFTSVKHIVPWTNAPGNGGVISFIHTNDGHILMSSWAEGIYKYDSNFNSLPLNITGIDPGKSYSAWSMCRLKDKRTVWMGLQPGIFIWNQQTNVAKYSNPAILENKTVRQIAEDNQGNIWLGTQSRGAFKWTPSKASKNFENGFSKVNIPNSLIEKIRVDSKGYVWICTDRRGAYKIDPLKDSIVEHLTIEGPPSKRLISNSAADVFEYNDSILIVVTGGLNIYNTKQNTITHITSDHGLPSNWVMGIEKDAKGYLWLALFNGLCRMNLEKRTFTYYDRSDGMSNDKFNLAASYHLPDGRMLFGTTTDFVVFDPAKIEPQTPPDITITEFKLVNRSLLIDSLNQLPVIKLDADENSLTIGFSALSFSRNKFVYYYKLEGIDKDWKKSDERNQAIYNYLPPGTYTFQARVENADGESSQKITELTIKIYPPFWKSWWFYTLIVLCGAILLYGFDRERMRKKEALQKMRSDIANNLHEEVNSALNNINILSEMAKLKVEKDAGKSRDYFEQIHSKSHNMIVAMDDMLWTINPENDNMRKTAERMKEYVDALKNRHGVNIDILVDKKVELLELNMKLRHDAFLLFKDGIRSILEAGATNCRVHIGCEKAVLHFTMQFNNKYCEIQKLNNLFNNHDIEKRLRWINARFHIQVHKSSSTVELQLPIR